MVDLEKEGAVTPVFKKGDRVRLHSVNIPPDHKWRKPYNGRFGSGSAPATHGEIVRVCKDPQFVMFKPDNRKTTQQFSVKWLELDPDYRMAMPELIAENETVLEQLEAKANAAVCFSDASRLVCGLVASLRFIHETALTEELTLGARMRADSVELAVRKILDAHVLLDDRLSDPYSTYAVIAVRNRFVQFGYSEAIQIVRKRRLPVIQEWWPHGSRRIVAHRPVNTVTE